jgi:hypothetical protein
VDGWLPISGMMNLKYFFETLTFPRVHPAAMFLDHRILDLLAAEVAQPAEGGSSL